MIELPSVTVAAFTPEPLDFGFTIEPVTGAALERQDRKGNRWQGHFELAPLGPDKLRVVQSRLTRGRYEPLAMPVPLQVPQGSAGVPLVDGAGQSGFTLNVKGCTAGYVCKEGFWLSIEDADGNHYLHNVAATAIADATGDLVVTLNEELRHPFADGATVRLAKPMMSGFVMGTSTGQLNVNQRTPLSFTLREMA